jgi:hypothetical protein
VADNEAWFLIHYYVPAATKLMEMSVERLWTSDRHEIERTLAAMCLSRDMKEETLQLQ